MSTDTLALETYATPATPPANVREDAELSHLPVFFKVTRRVDTLLLTWWQRLGYELLCRRLPAKWRIPPVVPMSRGGFATFAEADDACTTPDDQILVLPWGWAYGGEGVDREVTCRPRDPDDAARYKQIKARFGLVGAVDDLGAQLRKSLAYARELEAVMREATDLFHRTMKTNDDDG